MNSKPLFPVAAGLNPASFTVCPVPENDPAGPISGTAIAASDVQEHFSKMLGSVEEYGKTPAG